MNKVVGDNNFGICGNCIFHKAAKFCSSNRAFRSCQKLSIKLDGPIEACSYFFDIKHVRLDDLRDVAWELDMKKKEKIGFIPPLPKGERNYLEDPLTGYRD